MHPRIPFAAYALRASFALTSLSAVACTAEVPSDDIYDLYESRNVESGPASSQTGNGKPSNASNPNGTAPKPSQPSPGVGGPNAPVDPSPTPTTPPPEPKPEPVKQACAMHIHRTNGNDGGCGPGNAESFRVYIGPSVPPLKNGADQSDPVTHDPARYPYVMVGVYGDREGSCSGYRQETNQSTWKIPDWTTPVSPLPTYYYALAFSPLTRMPHTYEFQGYTYKLMTETAPGQWDFGGPESDCVVYSETFSPLMIDLAGNGIALSAPSAGPIFDLTASGAPLHYSWPTTNTCSEGVVFLAYDRNGNGEIDTVDELFGNDTTGPDGAKASNGFEALKKYDTNLDGVIDERDPVYAKLVTWADRDSNGKADDGELGTLRESGITQVDLGYENVTQRLDTYGNQSRQRSTVSRTNSRSARIFDVWLSPW